MIKKEKKLLHTYFTTGYLEVGKILFDFAAVGKEVGLGSNNPNKMWKYAGNIVEMLGEDGKKDGILNLEPVEKAVISLLDTKKLTGVVAAMRKVQQIMAGGLVAPTQNSALRPPASAPLVLSQALLRSVGINQDVQAEWQIKFAKLAPDVGQIVLRTLTDIQTTALDVQRELAYVAVVMGLTAPIKPFEVEELRAFVRGSYRKKSQIVPQVGGADGEVAKEQDLNAQIFRFARTCKEGMRSEDQSALADFFMEVLSAPLYSESKDNMFSWHDTYIFMLMLHTLWYRFELLSVFYQDALIQYYLYRSLVVGVPVVQKMKETVYLTKGPILYVSTNQRFFEGLEINNEAVPLNLEASEYTQVDLIVGRAEKQSPEEEVGSEMIVKNLYIQEKNKQLIYWAEQLVFLYAHLKQANLVDHNFGGELPPDVEVANDMILLVSYFGIGEAGSKKIIEYFSQDLPRVSLLAFINQLKLVADLKKQITVDNALDLSEALQKANFIPEDEDLVEFHEEDAKFHWNEDLFSTPSVSEPA